MSDDNERSLHILRLQMNEIRKSGGLSIWTIYDHPLDFPNHFVARCFIYDQPTGSYMTADTVDQLRAVLCDEMHLTCLMRSPEDHPSVVESWI